MALYVYCLIVFWLVARAVCAAGGGVACESSGGFCNPTQRDCINAREPALVSYIAACTVSVHAYWQDYKLIMSRISTYTAYGPAAVARMYTCSLHGPRASSLFSRPNVCVRS